MSKTQTTITICALTIALIVQTVCLVKLRADFYVLQDYAVQNRSVIMYLLDDQEQTLKTNGQTN